MTAPAEYFLQRLCTKDEFARIQAAYDLYWYVKCELTEVPQEVANAFREKFDFIIPELLTSNISGERSAAIFAIACLAQGDASFSNVAPTNLRQTNPAGVASIRFHRYTHYLRNILPSSDANLVQLAVRAGAHLALRLSNLYTTEYVYFELKRATEWLQSASTDRTDNRLSAVIVMKELAYIAPTFFYQHTPHFFDCIFEALMDGKVLEKILIIKSYRSRTVAIMISATERSPLSGSFPSAVIEYTPCGIHHKSRRVQSTRLSCGKI
ncbi:Serine/threonine-protein kinase mTOR [Trichinella sp. T6]|nr:Serine/threonine-protein kinase mTOR [Trichinella sp. T6]